MQAFRNEKYFCWQCNLFSSFLRAAYVIIMLQSGRLMDSLGAHQSDHRLIYAEMLNGTATGLVTMLLTRLGLGAGEAPTEPERQRILVERHAGEVMPTGGVGYRRLLRSMWGLAISQSTGVYSVYLHLSWLPDYLDSPS